MRKKIRKKSFWISLAAAVTLLLQLLGVKVDAPLVNEIVGVVCGILMLLGIITPDGSDEQVADTEQEEEEI